MDGGGGESSAGAFVMLGEEEVMLSTPMLLKYAPEAVAVILVMVGEEVVLYTP